MRWKKKDILEIQKRKEFNFLKYIQGNDYSMHDFFTRSHTLAKKELQKRNFFKDCLDRFLKYYLLPQKQNYHKAEYIFLPTT